MLNGWMVAGLTAGLLSAAAATVYLTNRPTPTETVSTPPHRLGQTMAEHAELQESAATERERRKALIAELNRDGYRCIDGVLLQKRGNEWRQLGICPKESD